MQITNTEKQVLQKHYAEKIKSWSQNLKTFIQSDDQLSLEGYIDNIAEAGQRILQIQRNYLGNLVTTSEDNHEDA